MIQKFIISWFRREAGLLFFLIGFSIAAVLTAGYMFWAQNALTVYASETATTSGAASSSEIDSEDDSASEASNIVVVIDPGHGGKNLGGEYEDYTEKDMTLTVAKAMKEELDKYEGITVYLTRMDDRDLSLEERCEFAKSVGADFLFCLHFNLSEYHTLFGAETWISAFGEQYSRGYAFASIEMELLEGLGLYSRGIKTRIDDTGADYYGIIRHATERNIPCVLIEHCHLDQENDKPFYDHKEKLEEFGRLDADAVARYYNLKSDILGKDYTSYKNIDVAVPVNVVRPDKSEPDVCIIELVEQNEKNGDVTLSVSAADYDSGMLYYTYSYDGGQTFSDLQRWPDKTRDTFEFTFNVPSGTIPQIIVNAYNGYDLYTPSNTLNLPSVSYADNDNENGVSSPENGNTKEEGLENGGGAGAADSQDEADALETSSGKVLSNGTYKNEPKPLTMVYFIKVCLIGIAIVLAMIWSILFVIKRQKRKKRRRQMRK